MPEDSKESPEARTGDHQRVYVPPELIEYGSVAKLTRSGGITVKDAGNMKQVGG